MLMPKRVKHRKVHRGRMTGKATRGNKVTYGDYGIQALEPAWINYIHFSEICFANNKKRPYVKIEVFLFYKDRALRPLSRIPRPWTYYSIKKDPLKGSLTTLFN